MNDYPKREKTAEDFVREIDELKIECALYELKYRLFNEKNYNHTKSIENDKRALENGKLREMMIIIENSFDSYLKQCINTIFDLIDRYGSKETIKVIKNIYAENDKLAQESESEEDEL